MTAKEREIQRQETENQKHEAVLKVLEEQALKEYNDDFFLTTLTRLKYSVNGDY